MMLKQHIVLVGRATNASENIASHEVVGIGPESVNDLSSHQYMPLNYGLLTHIVIVPNIDLGDLSIHV